MRSKQGQNFMLNENNILRKAVKLRYTIEPTIVVPRKLTSLIIVEFHNGKGQQLHHKHDKMLLLVGRHVQRCTLTHPQLPVMYTVST